MKRALVVDDDSQVLSLTGRWLQAAGYDVVLANNFHDARAEIQCRKPEIVVADVRLGEFNGLQLGILAREARSDVRLVIISGWDDPVLRRDAEELEAVFMQKPLRAAELLSTVQKVDEPAHPTHVDRCAVTADGMIETARTSDPPTTQSSFEGRTEALQVLMVEDLENDADLMAWELARTGLHATCLRVDTETELKNALTRQHWDVVLTDYTMPQLTVPAVLTLVRECSRDIPCILVSGTASEDAARAAMALGVDDFVSKHELSALGEVVMRGLADAETRRAWRQVMRVRFQRGQELRVKAWGTHSGVLEGSRLNPGLVRDALLLNEGDVSHVHLQILSCEVLALSHTEAVYQSLVTVFT